MSQVKKAILLKDEQGRITPMLHAFFGPDYADWWLYPDPGRLRTKEYYGGG
jgi:hypothetical protein